MNSATGSAKSWRSERLSKLGSSIFVEVTDWKRAAIASGMDIIDLGIGSPDQPPTENVRQALSDAALRTDMYAYPAIKGGLPYKEQAAAWMLHRFGVTVDPASEVVTLLGSQDGLANLAMATCNPGDVVLLPNPGYPIYMASLVLAGVQAELMPLRPENNYLPDLEAISEEVWQKAKFILLNYPNNPLSAVADLSFFEKLLDKAKKYGVLVVHDIAYSEMGYDGYKPPSILQVAGASKQAVEFHSMSKSFNMAGCRIGFMVGNREAVSALRELKANVDYGVFEPVQEASIVALREAINEPDKHNVGELYERRRDAFITALHKEGWYVESPKATMFVWAKLPDMTWSKGSDWSSRTISQEMLKATGVVVIPGEAFGSEGEGYVRIALVEEENRLLEAAERIGRFIRGEHVIE
ncbi:aminotransferase class I/II-fold pyridoxal phosphate-dependent enzyme [Paenibacillus sp. GSMTC-2017]|uniref:aminotransferase class I/II-fold pyridoxal phosphate-dependent enzyme n=1 Tax=Paenibacillus sp. GSMTC-2017 TaxID=2794350 RepID=UPI0018D8AE4E|nr:aminotransferase class I/II-fold pyridoxal phosphate-dependent enzyme [Paenibacillus sp. GSMTC-2017]MBH5317323.1 aminotransferase class I/II-fold pyridoxal phosphate-dependent enzyme [Paenibacillus sp. GSMTC-2017]